MPGGLDIALAPERLDEGSPEERAAFGMFTVRAGDVCLTEGFDFYVSNYRPGPLVSGYHAAEWFAWNWWRLTCEPRSETPDWWRAHKMTAIGEGYQWPNITIFSDGLRTALLSQASLKPDAKPFRYVGANARVVLSTQLVNSVDAFVTQVIGRLRDAGVHQSNLDIVWDEVLSERGAPDLARRRRIEALLALDPDESDDGKVEALLRDASEIGDAPVTEIAADNAHGGQLLSLDILRDIANSRGFASSPQDAAHLFPGTVLPAAGSVVAWRLGAEAARALRAQQKLETAPIGNGLLAKLAGVQPQVLEQPGAVIPIAFALDHAPAKSCVVLRSKWKTGRRFELARLLGDRLVRTGGGKLLPATRAYTYRQKMQRSFAAELLSPFDAVDDMMKGDYSAENQEDAANHFSVSPLTIRTLLVNHGRLERQDFSTEFDAAA